jgi:hypothetical protein
VMYLLSEFFFFFFCNKEKSISTGIGYGVMENVG